MINATVLCLLIALLPTDVVTNNKQFNEVTHYVEDVIGNRWPSEKEMSLLLDDMRIYIALMKYDEIECEISSC